MENLFYYFGIIYGLFSIYRMYNWKYGDKITVEVRDDTTLSDLIEINKKLDEKPKTIIGYLLVLILFLGFCWIVFGAFSYLPEKLFFIYVLILLTGNFLYMFFIGFSIGMKKMVELSPKVKQVDDTKAFPLCYMIELTKIILIGFILFCHFIN